jgi:hypothetical protein
MNTPHQPLVVARAATSDRHAEVKSLLRAIAPAPQTSVNPQRFACLRPLLRVGLSRDGRDRNLTTARRALAEAAEALADPYRYRCLRALAILHWHWAVEEEQLRSLHDEARRCYAFAGLLWRRLLPDEAFWDHFAAEHQLAAEHRAKVRKQIADDMLMHHLNHAKRYMLSSNGPAGRIHFTCLANWEQPPPVLAGSGQGAPAPRNGLAAEVAQRASELQSSWVSEILLHATNRLSESLEALPAGMSRNFTAALAVASPALEVMPDNRRLLVFSVKNAAEYIYELAVADRFLEARQVLSSVVPLARRLAKTYLRPNDTPHPDNQAVCSLFLLACQLTEDPTESLTYLTERRHWGGPSDGVDERSHEAHYYFRLGKLALSGQNFAEGERQLRLAIQLDAQDEVYRKQLAILYIRWAESLNARAGARLRNLAASINSFLAEACRGGAILLRQPQQLHQQALEKTRLAFDVSPPSFREELKASAAPLTTPLDFYWHVLRSLAEDAIKHKQTQHLPSLDSAFEAFPAPAGDSRFEEARPLRAALCHALQESAYGAEDLDGAVGFARRAAQFDPSHPMLKQVLEQLEFVQANGGLKRWRLVKHGAAET